MLGRVPTQRYSPCQTQTVQFAFNEGAQRLNKGMSQSFYLLTPLVYSITNFDLGFDKIVTLYCMNYLFSLTKSLISLVFLFLINFIIKLFMREFFMGKIVRNKGNLDLVKYTKLLLHVKNDVNYDNKKLKSVILKYCILIF